MKKFLQMMLNPVFIIVYFLFLYVFLKLCKYGRGFLPFDMPILMVSIILLLIWLAVCVTLMIVKKEFIMIKWQHYLKIALVLMTVSTLYSGYRVYDMIINKTGKISYYYDEILKDKEMTLNNRSIFTGGFNEFMETAKKTMSMPNELYLSGSANIKCGYDGRISSFDMFVYGKDNNETKSYLISYKGGGTVEFKLDGYVDPTYEDDKKFQPFLDALESIKMDDYIEPFQIKYSGVQNFGYNNKNIYYVDKKGAVKVIENLTQEIQGYTVILEPLTELGPGIKKYVYVDNVYNIPKTPVKKGDNKTDEDSYLKSMISDLIGYKLKITDAAAGSRFYSLYMTVDGGVNWDECNQDPFSGELGVSSGIVFFDEKLGYIGMSHSGGDTANLYCTKDGGKTFTKVDLQSPEPYDYPSMPYKENGVYKIKVTIGANNDQPNDFLLYTSPNVMNWKVSH